MSNPRAVLQGIQERADKATGGPWITFDTSSPDPDFNDGLPHILMPASMRDRPTWNEIGYVSEDYPDDAEFVVHARTDVPKLVAALRSVLAYADSIDHPDHGENAEREQVCDTCRIRAPFRGGAYWPCVYRRHAEEIRAAITETLGGTDA